MADAALGMIASFFFKLLI